MRKITRLPEVRPLSQILPNGAEGGKEFARIVDLLLFYAATRNGNVVNLFSDRSGDYYGLDSVHENFFRREQNTGYQYKFFPSPLSSAHRAEIVASLQKAATNQVKLRLKRWVLVTPDDLVQSSQRKGGGDVEWFRSLKTSLSIDFEIEHWGHKKLIALFLDTPRLCLYYYPEIIPSGHTRRVTIQEVRQLYDKNLAETNNRIEFIGMSVYKAEATHGVPIENIYIPVSAIPFPTTNSSTVSARNDPLTFLQPGARFVVLGDPGSGKSTLIKFLAMVGNSKNLQRRYNAPPDSRLAIPIVLRKYGDALKINKNISLLEYIVTTARADFSIPNLDGEFFEFYLESGQAIVFFDGLDELPDTTFKQLVRDRINTFLNCYPLVSAIVTSRIVGYSSAFGFDPKRFQHFQLAPLLLSEIELFVHDWYAARIENSADREANIADLLRILRNPELNAIRTLAENPLLLTIVALVHRIDAILPDERVVLYQKCTETLLNTWHNWKYIRSDDALGRGRIERTNRRRIETLATYMHEKSGEKKKTSRAVLTEIEVIDVLVKDIQQHDGILSIPEAKDLATEFLDFIKQKAGLLIEVGDKQYSFIHLTFQEYLAATALTASIEMGGVKVLWKRISTHLKDARWHEVIRLLIAGLKSDEAQAFLVEQLIRSESETRNINIGLLLGGLLLDGVKTAERYTKEITSALFNFLSGPEAGSSDIRIISLLRTLSTKHSQLWDSAYIKSWENNEALRPALLLLSFAVSLSEERRAILTEPKNLNCDTSEIEKLALLLGNNPWERSLSPITVERLEKHHKRMLQWASNSRDSNFLACASQAIFSFCPPALRYQYWYLLHISCFRTMNGPFYDFMLNDSILTLQNPPVKSRLEESKALAILAYQRYRREVASERKQERLEGWRPRRLRALEVAIKLCSDHICETRNADDINTFSARRDPRAAITSTADRAGLLTRRGRPLLNILHGVSSVDGEVGTALAKDPTPREAFLSPELLAAYIDTLAIDLDLQPSNLWKEAIRSAVVPVLPNRIHQFTGNGLARLQVQIAEGDTSIECLTQVALFHLYDIWLYAFHGFNTPSDSPIAELSKQTDEFDTPELNIARRMREIALGLDDDHALLEIIAGSNAEENIFLSANLLQREE